MYFCHVQALSKFYALVPVEHTDQTGTDTLCHPICINGRQDGDLASVDHPD